MKKQYRPKHMKPDRRETTASKGNEGVPMGMPFPDPDGEGEYTPTPDNPQPVGGDRGGAFIPMPDGSNIAPNGAVIRNPWSDQPEILPDNEFTPDKEDLNLLIM